MKKAGVSYTYKKKFKRTTDSNHNLPVARNLLDRQFDVAKPITVWRADISCLWSNEGWLYLAVVIDLYSRKAVGWAINKRMKVSLVKEALAMACFRRRPGKGLIHHSDRGSQYAAHEYQNQLKQYGMTCGMSRKGDCWDNAVVESFFHTLKVECIHEKRYATREEARTDVIDYIEMFYNSNRLHSTLGYVSPNDFEKEVTIHAA
jgi:transposase InsO family protein